MLAHDPVEISLARIEIARYITSLSCQTCDSLGVFNGSANIEVKIKEGEDSLSKLRHALS